MWAEIADIASLGLLPQVVLGNQRSSEGALYLLPLHHPAHDLTATLSTYATRLPPISRARASGSACCLYLTTLLCPISGCQQRPGTKALLTDTGRADLHNASRVPRTTATSLSITFLLASVLMFDLVATLTLDGQRLSNRSLTARKKKSYVYCSTVLRGYKRTNSDDYRSVEFFWIELVSACGSAARSHFCWDCTAASGRHPEALIAVRCTILSIDISVCLGSIGAVLWQTVRRTGTQAKRLTEHGRPLRLKKLHLDPLSIFFVVCAR